VGFVSGDLRRHPVAFFLEPLLAHRDRAQFACFLYANQNANDAFSERLNAVCDGWRTIVRADDETVCRQIRADGIDILIDLSGHTGYNRLPLFARRPAPVSMTWLGYPGTTGLSTIDYRISDAIADPPDLDPAWSSERVIHLENGFHCFRPPAENVAPGPAPVRADGRITFGSFNNLSKVSDETIALWARVLARVERSRLLVKAEALSNGQVQDHLRERFARCGITADRLVFTGWTGGLAEHLAMYRQVDIALDTFPYGGTTTTMEALWMGVPVLTLCGQTHMARVGASLLTHAGCPQWVAQTEASFVDLAAGLAADPAGLADLRQTLRTRLEESPLMDAPGFCRRFEAACREAWRAWCSRG
jgi:predicted O-linked N-acetylglucosamine transferase (SPINDLY family)